MGDLSPHVSLAEMTKSQVAARRGIDNTPDAAAVQRLRLLCLNVLEPVRAHFARPLTISSGFRSARLNRAIGGAAGSQHCRGEAADIEIAGVPNGEIAEWIRDTLSFDQLILEAYTPGMPASGWVHVSYRAQGCRGDCLTWPGPAVGYLKGLVL
jgi:hypothetical protein